MVMQVLFQFQRNVDLMLIFVYFVDLVADLFILSAYTGFLYKVSAMLYSIQLSHSIISTVKVQVQDFLRLSSTESQTLL